MGLLCLLPEFVATGRKLEGWLIQYVAYATVEHEEESNPFLYQMFCHGYDEWCAKKHRNDAALFRDLGIDVERLKGMTMDEIDEWLAAQASDPAKNQALEAFLGAHPELRAESVANLEAMERSSVRLLEREDCQFLLLPFAEIKPWLLRLGQRLSEERLSAEDPQQPLSEEGMARIFEDTLRPLLDGMAESIFTPQRIRELVAALTKYRSDRFNAGDKHACTLASGALGLLGRGDRAGRQYFLTGLCWSSLGAAIKNGPQEAGDVQAMEEAGEGQRA